jgi:hypothetical protein
MLVASMEKPLVVGVMGAGHALHGFDVTHQLHDLGVQNVAVFAVGQRQILQKSRERCGGCRVWRSTQCFRIFSATIRAAGDSL